MKPTDHDQAARNADLRAAVLRNHARHHRDAAERDPLRQRSHLAAADEVERIAAEYQAISDRHRAQAIKARGGRQTDSAA